MTFADIFRRIKIIAPAEAGMTPVQINVTVGQMVKNVMYPATIRAKSGSAISIDIAHPSRGQSASMPQSPNRYRDMMSSLKIFYLSALENIAFRRL